MRAKWAKKRMRRRQRKKRKMKKWVQTTPQGVNSTCRTIWSWVCEWGAPYQWCVFADTACSSEFGVCASAARASVVPTFPLKYKLESSWWHSFPFLLCFPHIHSYFSLLTFAYPYISTKCAQLRPRKLDQTWRKPYIQAERWCHWRAFLLLLATICFVIK